ncbi:hedgehog-interacting protein-like isoform X2 [Arapaima gigas]
MDHLAHLHLKLSHDLHHSSRSVALPDAFPAYLRGHARGRSGSLCMVSQESAERGEGSERPHPPALHLPAHQGTWKGGAFVTMPCPAAPTR